MFHPVLWIREWLEKRFRRSLEKLSAGFLLIEQEQKDPVLQKYTLGVEKYLWGLIPVFQLQSGDALATKETLRSLDSLQKGFLMFKEDGSGGPMLTRCTIEVKQLLGGIFPVFRIKEYSSFSLSDAVSSLIMASQAEFVGELEETPKTAITATGGFLVQSAKQRIGKSKGKITSETELRFHEFEEQVLSKLIKTDRNQFRQLLLEQLSRTAADTFDNIVKRHIAELVLRTREECLREGLIEEKKETGSEQTALPTGTRFFQKKGRMTLFVIEQPPTKRTIQTVVESGRQVVRYELSLPFVIFFVVLRNRQFDRLHVLFRNQPLRTLEDALLCPNFSNVHPDFRICFTGPGTAKFPADTAEATLENFWGGRFNLSHLPEFLSQISLEEWEKRSQQDSLFGLSFKWREANQTVASVMEKIGKDFKEEEKKKKATGGINLSTLQKCVDGLSARVAKEIQEACFFLIPKWNIEETTLNDVTARFKQIVQEICLQLRTELEKDIEGVLSETTMERAFQKAIQRTVAAVKESSGNSVVAARQRLLEVIKEKVHDTDTH